MQESSDFDYKLIFIWYDSSFCSTVQNAP